MTLVLNLPIAEELAQVRETITRFTQLPDPSMNRIAESARALSGKHLRATLLLLSAKLHGPVSPPIVELAALAEIVHTATLIHDDVFDAASVRRGHPSMNRRWGSEIALLFGDYLLCQAFIHMHEIRPLFVKRFSETLRDMCFGQILETLHHFDGEMSEDLYLSIIEKKTASLFRTCCALGAELAGAQSQAVEQLGRFGLEAGMAFQVVDDILDLTGDETLLGKPTVHDIGNGKLTLPLIHALQRATPAERSPVLAAFTDRHLPQNTVAHLRDLMARYGGIEHAKSVARRHLDRAKALLAGFPTSETRQAMKNVADLFVQRAF